MVTAKTGLSLPTLRMLERSRGNLASWNKTLLALGLVLRGRNLPAGDTLGRQIAALRKHRELGQRALAIMVGVTQPFLGCISASQDASDIGKDLTQREHSRILRHERQKESVDKP